MQTLMLTALLLTSSANAKQPPQPTTVPTSYIVKLADAVALSKLQNDDLETNLTDKLTKPQVEETTYFGEIDEFGEDDEQPIAALPIIALHTTETWTALPLMGDGLRNAGWKYVAAGPGPNEIWGVLDTVAGNTRSTFVLAHSIDGGATFELRIFHKPCKLAQFFDFAMSRDGQGRASVSLEADCGIHKAGIYHFQTADDGKTWSPEPRFEPDSMIRADEVPDEEQPAESNGGAKSSIFRIAPPKIQSPVNHHFRPSILNLQSSFISKTGSK